MYWTINAEIYLDNNEMFELETVSFRYKSFICEIEFRLNDFTLEREDGSYLRRIDSILFSLTSLDDDHSRLVQLSTDDIKLVKNVITITNIVAKAIRLNGFGTGIHEISFDSNDFGDFIKKANLIKVQNINELPDISCKDEEDIENSNHNDISIGTGVIHLSAWNINVLYAIEEGYIFPPERAFHVNCIEQYHLKNFRISVIEATIALEIALNKYLKIYLSKYKGLSRDNVEKFLGPDLGLTSRVRGLLILTLSEESLVNLDIDAVLKFINWRNKIIHSTGELPEGIQDEVFTKSFNNVLNLIILLSVKTKRIENSQEIKVGSLLQLP